MSRKKEGGMLRGRQGEEGACDGWIEREREREEVLRKGGMGKRRDRGKEGEMHEGWHEES